MKKLVISNSHNPYFNIALENHLFNEASEDLCVYLWQNDSCVIVGRNQNLFVECDLHYLEKEGIYPVRRLSGGGAVFQDRGNLCFTIITKEELGNTEKNIALVEAALKELGITCEFSVRNDLLVEGRKFSGHAYYVEDGNYMYHGTMMVDVDLEELTRALTPLKLKLESKGIKSVRGRVVNLCEVNPEITIEKLINAFKCVYNYDKIEYINEDALQLPLASQLASDEWLYGESPKFNIQLEKKYDLGNIAVRIFVEDGMMSEVTISCDSLEPIDFAPAIKNLKGQLFTEDFVWEQIEKCFY